jgi:hypothetical protein
VRIVDDSPPELGRQRPRRGVLDDPEDPRHERDEAFSSAWRPGLGTACGLG